MVDVINYHKDIETIIEPKIDFSLLRKKSSSKTFSGWLVSKLRQALKNENKEMSILISEIYKKYNEFHKKEEIPLIDIEIIEGWKGADNISIYKGFENDFIIKQHTKDKETKEVTTTTHKVSHENVNRILFYIKKWEIGESHKCYDFAKIIGENDWKEVWKKRMEVYFPLYYFPIKILEELKVIRYSGRGVITRIK